MTTNYDRIRQMSVEEMAEFMTDLPDMDFSTCKMCLYMARGPEGQYYQCCDDTHNCRQGVIAWLKQEHKEND